MNYNNNDLFDKSTKWKILAGVLGAMAGGVMVVGLVLYMNNETAKNRKHSDIPANNAVSEEIDNELTIEQSGLTSKDLDFWNIYDEDTNGKSVVDDSDFSTKDKSKLDENYDKNLKDLEAESLSGNKISETEKNSDNQFNVGSQENPDYVDINETALKNNYSTDNFRLEGEKLSYYSSNRKISSFGIDVSKYQGRIDWEKVANSGIDFAIIRMGVRGYSSGQVVIDEEFKNNIIGAISHGIDVGIYFYSQAITEAEAIEEANYAVASVQGYAVSYPICFYTETIENETARTDDLSAEELTNIANAFCKTVEGYGYRSMIVGNKYQLSKRLDLSALSSKSFLLIDPLTTPDDDDLTMSDYPYQYSMWQYSSIGKIDGINGDVNLDISFVDYLYR